VAPHQFLVEVLVEVYRVAVGVVVMVHCVFLCVYSALGTPVGTESLNREPGPNRNFFVSANAIDEEELNSLKG